MNDVQFNARLDSLESRLDNFSRREAVATADVRTNTAALEALSNRLDQFSAKRATAQASVNAQGSNLEALQARLAGFDGMLATATAMVETNRGFQGIEVLDKALEGFSRKVATAKANVHTAEGMQQIIALDREFAAFNGKVAWAQANVTAGEARRELNFLESALHRVGIIKIHPQVDVDTGAASAKVTAFGLMLRTLAGYNPTINIDVDTGMATAKIIGFRALVASASTTLQAFSGVIFGAASAWPILAAAIVGVTVLFAPLLAALTAVGAMLTVLGGFLAIAAGGFGLLALAMAPMIKGLIDAQDPAKSLEATQVKLTAAQQKLTEAIEKYGPASRQAAEAQLAVDKAQKAVNAASIQQEGGVQRLIGAWGNLKNSFAENFTQNQRLGTVMGEIGAKVLDLAASTLPRLSMAATAVGATFKMALQRVIDVFNSPVEQSSLNRLLGSMPLVVARLTQGFGQFGAGLVNIFAQAAPLAQSFATYIRDISTRFLEWTRSEEGRRQISQFLQTARTMAPAVAKFIGDIARAITNIKPGDVKAAADGLVSIGRTISGWITTIKQVSSAIMPILRLFTQWVGVINSVGNAITGPLMRGIRSLASAGAPAFNSLVQGGLRATTSLQRFFQGLPARIGGYFRAIPGAAAGAWSAIVNGARGVADGIINFFANLPSRIGAFFRAIPGVAAGVWAAVVNGARTVADGIINFFASIPSRVGSFLSGVASVAQGAWDAVVNGARVVADGIINFFAAIPERVGAFFSTLGAAATQGLTNIATAAGTVAGQVVVFFQNLPANLSAIWAQVVDGARVMADGIIAGARAMADGIIAAVQGIPGVADAAWQAILAAARVMADGIIAGARAMADGIISFIQGIPGAADSAWQAMLAGARAMADGIIAGARAMADAIINFFASLPANAEAAWQAILAGARAMADGIIAAATSAFHSIQAGVEALPGIIGAAFNAAGEAAISAARWLADGVIGVFRGLGDTLSSITSYISDTIIKPFMDAYTAVVGASIIPDLARDVGKVLRTMPGDIDVALRDVPDKIQDPFAKGAKAVQDAAKGLSGTVGAIGQTAMAGAQVGAATPTAMAPGAQVAAAGAAAPGATGPVAPGASSAEEDPLAPLAKNSEERIADLQKNTQKVGEDLKKNFVGNMSEMAQDGTKEFEQLKVQTAAQSQQMNMQNVAAVTDMQRKATQQYTVLNKEGVTRTEDLKVKTTAAVSQMRTTNVAALTDQQVKGTQQFTTLNTNATARTNTMKTATNTAMSAMRTTNVATLTDQQVKGTQQFTTLQTNGTQQLSTLQTNGTNSTTQLQQNATTQMTGARDNIISTLTSANQTGSQQMESLRSSGGASMQAANSEFQVPVGNAASGIQNYLNDMLYGMGQVIAAANLPLTAPGQFQPRLTGGIGMAEGGTPDMDGQPIDAGTLQRMLAQGKVGFDEGKGGVAPPGQSYLHWWGEGQDANATEYYIVDGRQDNLPILERAAASLGHEVVPAHKAEAGTGAVQPYGRPGIPPYLDGSRFEDGGIAVRNFAHGAAAWEDLWTPRTAQIARQTEQATGAAPNTYFGHPDGYEYRESYSIDWWNGSRGTNIGVDLGNQVLSYILDNFYQEMTYWIWNYQDSFDGSMAAAEPHDDHVHATFMNDEGLMSAIGAKGVGPNLRGLIEEHIAAVPDMGASTPEAIATAIGTQMREEMVNELLKYSGPGKAGTNFSGGGDVDSNVALGQQMAANMGWTGSEWEALYQLWNYESGWSHTADNPSSDAFGIPQGMMGPGGHEPPEGYFSDPAVQIDWGLGYIAQRYGSPSAALANFESVGSYQNGGLAIQPHKATIAENGPELVLPLSDPQSASRFLDLVEAQAQQRSFKASDREVSEAIKKIEQNTRPARTPARTPQNLPLANRQPVSPLQAARTGLGNTLTLPPFTPPKPDPNTAKIAASTQQTALSTKQTKEEARMTKDQARMTKEQAKRNADTSVTNLSTNKGIARSAANTDMTASSLDKSNKGIEEQSNMQTGLSEDNNVMSESTMSNTEQAATNTGQAISPLSAAADNTAAALDPMGATAAHTAAGLQPAAATAENTASIANCCSSGGMGMGSSGAVDPSAMDWKDSYYQSDWNAIPDAQRIEMMNSGSYSPASGYAFAEDGSVVPSTFWDQTDYTPVPGYASGGMALNPQLATIAENGPEVVIPLTDPSTVAQFLQMLDQANRNREFTTGGNNEVTRVLREIANNTQAASRKPQTTTGEQTPGVATGAHLFQNLRVPRATGADRDGRDRDRDRKRDRALEHAAKTAKNTDTLNRVRDEARNTGRNSKRAADATEKSFNETRKMSSSTQRMANTSNAQLQTQRGQFGVQKGMARSAQNTDASNSRIASSSKNIDDKAGKISQSASVLPSVSDSAKQQVSIGHEANTTNATNARNTGETASNTASALPTASQTAANTAAAIPPTQSTAANTASIANCCASGGMSSAPATATTPTTTTPTSSGTAPASAGGIRSSSSSGATQTYSSRNNTVQNVRLVENTGRGATVNSYQSGGFAVTPQIAHIAEEGPEVVLPLNNARRFREMIRSADPHGHDSHNASREHRTGWTPGAERPATQQVVAADDGVIKAELRKQNELMAEQNKLLRALLDGGIDLSDGTLDTLGTKFGDGVNGSLNGEAGRNAARKHREWESLEMNASGATWQY